MVAKVSKELKGWLEFCLKALLVTVLLALFVNSQGSTDYGGLKLWLFVPFSCVVLRFIVRSVRKAQHH